MTKEIVIETLDHACLNYRPSENLILHSDLGSQYLSEAYEAKLKELSIQHFSSRKGCPYENAAIELFHRKRIHSSIDYLTPNQMEELALQA